MSSQRPSISGGDVYGPVEKTSLAVSTSLASRALIRRARRAVAADLPIVTGGLIEFAT